MGNRRLNDDELENARRLLEYVRRKLMALSGGDKDLLFAYRRKIYKELIYDERSKPMVRRKLKKTKFTEQNGKCAICEEPLPDKYSVLDRLKAADGYTTENTRLIHQNCDTSAQAAKGYS